MQDLSAIIREAMQHFHENATDQSSADWLTGYLRTHLEKKQSDEIERYSEELFFSVVVMEKKQTEMNAALERGVSAENWAAKELADDGMPSGAAAKDAAELLNGLMAAQDGDAELIDTTAEDWSDDNWNEYQVKETLKSVASEAGRAVLHQIGADLFGQAAEESCGTLDEDALPADLSDPQAKTDMKVAVSAGLSVAEDQGVIPETGASAVAAAAHTAVEAAAEIAQAVQNKQTLTEALAHIKNTAAATLCGVWEANKQRIANAVGTAATLAGKAILGTLAGKLFGAAGAAIVGAVTGLLTSKTERPRQKTVINEAGKAVWGFLTKERHLPSLKRKTKLKNTALT